MPSVPEVMPKTNSNEMAKPEKLPEKMNNYEANLGEVSDKPLGLEQLQKMAE